MNAHDAHGSLVAPRSVAGSTGAFTHLLCNAASIEESTLSNAGWREDPEGRHQYRYHDGTRWTEYVADDGRQSTDPMAELPARKPVPEAPVRSGIRRWRERRRAEKAAAESDRAALRELVSAAAHGDGSALERIPAFVDDTRRSWKDRQLRQLADETFLSLAADFLRDDILTQDERNRLFGIAQALGLFLDYVRDRHRDAWEAIVIAGLNDGRLPALPPSDIHIVTKGTEVVHGEWAAALMKEVTIREWRGGSSGVSIPLGGGIRYRVGAVRGRSVVVGQQLVAEDQGVFAVTSKRCVFVGPRKTLEFQHAKLVALEQFVDGVRLNVSNRQKASLLRIPVENSPTVCGALIMAAASRG